MALNCPSCNTHILEIKHFCYNCGVQFELETQPKAIANNTPVQSPIEKFSSAQVSGILNTILLAAFTANSLNAKENDLSLTFAIITVASLITCICNFIKSKNSVFCSAFLTLGIQPPIIALILMEVAKNPKLLSNWEPVLILSIYLILAIITIVTSCISLKALFTVSETEAEAFLDGESVQICSICREENLSSNRFCTGCGKCRVSEFRENKAQERKKFIPKLMLFSSAITWAVLAAGVFALQNLILSLIFSQALILLLSIVSISICSEYKNIFSMLKLSPRVIKTSGYAIMLLVISISLNYLLKGLYQSPALNNLSSLFFESSTQLYFLVILLCIVPGVLEEIAFRGFLQNKLTGIFGLWPAILTSSLVFSIIHFQGFGMIYIFILSLGLGWLFNKSQSLVPCIIIHSTHNFAVLLMAVQFNGQ